MFKRNKHLIIKLYYILLFLARRNITKLSVRPLRVHCSAYNEQYIVSSTIRISTSFYLMCSRYMRTILQYITTRLPIRGNNNNNNVRLISHIVPIHRRRLDKCNEFKYNVTSVGILSLRVTSDLLANDVSPQQQ